MAIPASVGATAVPEDRAIDGAKGKALPLAKTFIRLGGAGNRFLLVFVLPMLAATGWMRYFVPTVAEAEGTWASSLAQFADAHTVATWIGLFLAFSAVAHHWSFLLPGSRAVATSRFSVLGTVVAIVACAAVALVVRSSVGVFRVQGTSMLPTLEPEDVVAARPLSVAAGASDPRSLPARGSIVVFKKPPGVEGPAELVKRVIGLPGDRITMDEGHPSINGWRVPSCDAGPYFFPMQEGGGAVGRMHVEFLDGSAYLMIHAHIGQEWTGPYDVKPGEVFVLGDDRNNSSDSRAWNGGAGEGLRVESIDAKVDRFLYGLRRDDHVDLAHALRPLDLFVRLDAIDTTMQRDGIAFCLRKRPAETTPPRPSLASQPGPASAGAAP